MAVNLSTLKAMRERGEKIAVLTCYDAGFARVLDAAAVDVLLVGDSLGMVVQGHRSTLPVKLAEMTYHTRCVAAGTQRAFIVADLPFGSYQPSPERAYTASARLMAAGAQMVKLEGGAVMVETVAFLTQRGIPVCAHLGLLPQSVNQLGGYKVQGREDAAAAQLVADARALEAAGAGMIVLEMVPATVGRAVTDALTIPTIGIGAGADCSGQVLVLYD
ncbi:MAG: 3-methyl-2-oxobutanoate hydroxymethyltransferase, partial [Thiobacillus sp.]|nr:3-methyl-2-oxobutanoate hydroxymethyltransferase [Thiobacillus sp.]